MSDLLIWIKPYVLSCLWPPRKLPRCRVRNQGHETYLTVRRLCRMMVPDHCESVVRAAQEMVELIDLFNLDRPRDAFGAERSSIGEAPRPGAAQGQGRRRGGFCGRAGKGARDKLRATLNSVPAGNLGSINLAYPYPFPFGSCRRACFPASARLVARVAPGTMAAPAVRAAPQGDPGGDLADAALAVAPAAPAAAPAPLVEVVPAGRHEARADAALAAAPARVVAVVPAGPRVVLADAAPAAAPAGLIAFVPAQPRVVLAVAGLRTAPRRGVQRCRAVPNRAALAAQVRSAPRQFGEVRQVNEGVAPGLHHAHRCADPAARLLRERMEPASRAWVQHRAMQCVPEPRHLAPLEAVQRLSDCLDSRS
jgi:hypothetical protein